MIEPQTTKTLQKAMEDAHKARAEAFQNLFKGWFGFKNVLSKSALGQHS